MVTNSILFLFFIYLTLVGFIAGPGLPWRGFSHCAEAGSEGETHRNDSESLALAGDPVRITIIK